MTVVGSPTKPVSAWDRYVTAVIDGEEIAGELVKAACRRHRDDLTRSMAEPGWPYAFSYERANRVVDFFSRLRLTTGLPRSKPFVPEPWQQFILASLFGWAHRTSGLRRFRSAHIMVARKNGKSHTMAGIGLYALVADNEYGAQVYSAATKKDQARFIWDAALEFRRQSGDLAEYIKKSVNALYVIPTNSKFTALSSDEDGMDGLDVHVGLIDELQNHKTDVVYGRIDTSTTARRQPLIISIATAGVERQSVCWRQHEYGANVVKGVFDDPTFFAYIAEADEGDDWEDENVWRKANPNWGIINVDDLRRKAQVARNQPSYLNTFKRLHLNMWTSQDRSWMPMHKWRECAGQITASDPVTGRTTIVDPVKRTDIEDALLAQWRLPYAGLDLSERGDITALVLLFPPAEADPRWVVLPYYFLPEEGIERRVKVDRVPYDAWVREGRIYTTPGAVVDYDFVKAEVLRLHRKLHIQGLGVDPHNALQLNQQLRGEGVPVVEVQQGWRSLSDPTKQLMNWTLEKKIAHLDEPVLTWMMGNMVVWQDAAGNVKPDKAKARERIDGVAALVNAMFLALSRQHSVYSTRGVITI